MLEMMQPPQGMEGTDVNFTEWLQEMMPKKKKRRTVHLHEARRILVDEDAACLRSEEHTSELQSQSNLVCRLLLEKKKKIRMLQMQIGKITTFSVAQRTTQSSTDHVLCHTLQQFNSSVCILTIYKTTLVLLD